jgi:hypothetical protein
LRVLWQQERPVCLPRFRSGHPPDD